MIEVVLAIQLLSLGSGGTGFLAAAFGAGAGSAPPRRWRCRGRRRLAGVLLTAALVGEGHFC